ncbi:hypothetical protein TGME49_231130 [Toxoplasma gondii ME49]|uniref:BOS complex subunit NCLN n=3 Tax=Toxoplasma gondii TaxID=5811 RepID=A0A0F7UX60_TOXGV|nr:hypothetical protein TGME49_231130 [Toxoplasma gondii ME49]EPT28961.1 hypothetical protein TGME49_231130 [Toxoplasma gondii ME49]ESS35585.1 M28 family peptidase [Toxoplasma gondii VEG]KYF46078.1 M28 family peptidase [Toxoplasma gondii ARI]CEL74827.1 TPA: nicalin 1 precursor homolog [Toxoplasma gondii VEG]|eukprot:XP_018636855.1 hypothetical protein TGME49_231130 [Toxoplasma gondii ME49]
MEQISRLTPRVGLCAPAEDSSTKWGRRLCDHVWPTSFGRDKTHERWTSASVASLARRQAAVLYPVVLLGIAILFARSHFLTVAQASPAVDFEAFPLLQYETFSAGMSKAAPVMLGAWGSSALNGALAAATVIVADSGQQSEGPGGEGQAPDEKLLEHPLLQQQLRSLSKKNIYIFRATHVPVALVDALLDRAQNVLLLLPPRAPEETGESGALDEAQVSEAERKRVYALEQRLITRFSAGACVFAFETPELATLYEELREQQTRFLANPNSLYANSLLPAFLYKGLAPTVSIQRGPLPPSHFAAGLQSASRLSAPLQGRNVFAWLPGRRPQEGGAAPTIAIVAHYDAFAAVPHLAFGAEGNGSGVAALMELARIFSRLYSGADQEDSQSAKAGSREPGNYSLLFLLADAGAADFAGAAQWLAKTEPRILESITYVLCLDDIAASPQLYLHTAKKYKEPRVRKLLQSLETAFVQSDLLLTLDPRKIVVQTPPKPFWAHEHFTMKKVIAGTLSSKPHGGGLWVRSSILDQNSSAKSRENLLRVVGALAEGLAHFVYEVDDFSVNIIEGSNRPLASFLHSWLSLASRSPRFYAFRQADKNAAKRNQTHAPSGAFADELHARLEKLVPSAQSQTFSLPASGTVFTYEPPMFLSVIETRPVLFDILCLFTAVAYCFTIYYSIVGWHFVLPAISNLTASVGALVAGAGHERPSRKAA